MNPKIILTIASILIAYCCLGQNKKSTNFLYRIQNADEECGYINSKGDTIVPIGKYLMCQDSIIKEIGFVYSDKGILCINTGGSVLFQVFNYDNGPDYPSNGLFRILKDGKIGYANLHGKVIIEPQYKCAWPFEKGKAKVSYNCNIRKEGEYDFWEGGEWFYVNRKGERQKLLIEGQRKTTDENTDYNQPQGSDGLGIDNNPFLNTKEVQYLNQLFAYTSQPYDFTNRKVGFFSGPNGKHISYKKNYFSNHGEPGTYSNYLILLSEEAKEKSGGYDILIVTWSKIHRLKPTRLMIKRLKETANE